MGRFFQENSEKEILEPVVLNMEITAADHTYGRMVGGVTDTNIYNSEALNLNMVRNDPEDLSLFLPVYNGVVFSKKGQGFVYDEVVLLINRVSDQQSVPVFCQGDALLYGPGVAIPAYRNSTCPDTGNSQKQ
jgi:hypothetical protein